MNEKEIGEIRRTLRFEHTNITKICGCYVNGKGEIITTFDSSFGLMAQDEAEKYLSIFRRTLSGTPDKNLLNLTFSSEQVTNGEEHKLLSELKASELKDAEQIGAFYDKVIASYISKENYVILLTYCAYDVPYKASDGQRVEGDSTVYSFVLGSICPVKMSKSALLYRAGEKQFRFDGGECAICTPEAGFLFPAFDDRQTNIYNALYYAASDENLHEELIASLFGTKTPMTASVENETFRTVLADALEENCSFSVVKKMHKEISKQLEEHKASKEADPLVLSKHQVSELLEDCGMPAEKREAFIERYDEGFGKGADVSPRNLVNPKKFELKTPDVLIKVAPGRSDLVETRVIDGMKYILIRADDGVELNGLNVTIENT